MAASTSFINPPPIVSCSSSTSTSHSHTHNAARKNGNSWWTPLFGLSSSEPDYVNKIQSGSGRVDRSRSSEVVFTEEKAKELRKRTIESSTFHDIMYHSAIASRLASDVSGR